MNLKMKSRVKMAVLEAKPIPSVRRTPGAQLEKLWSSSHVIAGVAERYIGREELLSSLPRISCVAEAEQVHGCSVAAIERSKELTARIAGCDALVTQDVDVALIIRSADCIPLFVSDPVRRVVGIAHVGWRGLRAQLPLRLISVFCNLYRSRPANLRIAFGPAIRLCCYEVGAEFAEWGGQFVQERDAHYMFDLVGLATAQLQQGGVRKNLILDSGYCTSCDFKRWHSIRREGSETGRLSSFIMLHS